MESGYVTTLDELKDKMEGENISKGIHKICYENHLVYTLFSLDSQIGLRTDSSMSIAKDLSFIIDIEGKPLPSSKDSHLVKNNKITYSCSLTNIPICFRQGTFLATIFLNQEDSIMIEVTTREQAIFIRTIKTSLAVTLFTKILS